MIHHAESRIPLMLTAVMGPGHDRERTRLRAGQPHMLPRLDHDGHMGCQNARLEVLVEEG